MSEISLRSVSREFRGSAPGFADRQSPVAALEEIDLTVSQGSFLAIVGPSGCGKSTLLRLIAGLDAPSDGQVMVGGEPVSGPAPDRGMVFQQDALFPWRTVAGNIGFGIQSSAGSDADRIVRDLIAEVGLGGFESHYPATLSGGMRQRAALARTLAPDPSTLLLDEPFGALDQITRQQMQELLAEICWNRAKTVVLVTHDVAEAIFLADRVLVMSARPGRIVDDISVDLPRPRSYTARTTDRFVALEARIVEALRSGMTESD